MAASSLLAPALSSSAKATLETSPKALVDEVWQIINREFISYDFNQEEWLATRTELLKQDYTSQEEAYSAIRKALKDLGDPYTRFLNPQEFEELSNQTTGELSGIGLRLEVNSQTQVLTVVEPLDNSPASEAGLQTGDKILKIDSKPTTLMTVEQASELIRGEEGTEVTLEVSRGIETPFEVTLKRAQVEVPVLHSSLKQEGQMRIGYLRLDEFSSHAAEQMKKAVEKLEADKVEGFVLDLRGNPGGLLFASVDIARMWIENGPIVRTVDRKGGDREFSANRTSITNLPLVVLVDGYSASASEILAGALKDNKRATIVGTRTFGKGLVQSVHPLSDGSGLAVTISRYYPPSGIDINKKGILPDIQLDSREEIPTALKGTGRDEQYARAVSVLSNIRLGQNRAATSGGLATTQQQ
ncbi:carboxyl-terminal processing protease CtpB [Oscillatoria sp. FACHB-1406]|uniref:carboxyl-terminal processing protease CtpB n=1 Tax=Oscillatoria sp. FACHB-1406 TaxID=2692846 RepID=UPI001F555672|nr:carboxyl-terminal processing protease CtpB [Oscillatoria sp. FACHB-1406]